MGQILYSFLSVNWGGVRRVGFRGNSSTMEIFPAAPLCVRDLHGIRITASAGFNILQLYLIGRCEMETFNVGRTIRIKI